MSNVSGFVFMCLCLQLVFAQFGFLQNHRQDRRYGDSFGFPQNFVSAGKRLTNQLTGVLHLRPEKSNSNPNYVYPFGNNPAVNNYPIYDQYGRPIHQYHYNQDNYRPTQNYPYGGPDGPVQFPTYNQDSLNVNPSRPTIEADNIDSSYKWENEENHEKPEAFPGAENNVPKEEIISIEKPNDPISTQAPNHFEFQVTNNSETSATEAENNNYGIPTIQPAGFKTITENPVQLSPLTPVPAFEARNNFNFGIFHESCTSVDGLEGSCISILNCEPFVKLLQDASTNSAVVPLLRKAHCGFEGNNPKVCCPKPGIPTGPPPLPTTTTTTTTMAPQEKSASDYVTLIPDPPVCGYSKASFSRVVGGVDAKLGDFPWMALLGYKNKRNGGTRWLCGGSLITSRHILTAAHCIHGHEQDLFVVRLGELDLEDENDGATPVDVIIKSMIKHEEYDPNAYTNDIGLLVLDWDVPFTDLIKPVCIPRSSELRANTFERYNPIIAGWGDLEFRGPAATHLQALQLPVVSNDFCANAYSAYKKQIIDQRVLCAGYEKGGKDACQGDSGGPLMQPIWNSQDSTTHFYQIGVVSFGKKCAEAGFPGVYTRVTSFVPWLEKHILGKA